MISHLLLLLLIPCPPAAVLQPGDSAYREAAAFASFLRTHDFVIRCTTRSTRIGTAELQRVAGFQTSDGPITVFFLRPGDSVTVSEERTPHGYRYTITRWQLRRRYQEESDNKIYYLRRGTWLMEVRGRALAAKLRHILAAR